MEDSKSERPKKKRFAEFLCPLNLIIPGSVACCEAVLTTDKLLYGLMLSTSTNSHIAPHSIIEYVRLSGLNERCVMRCLDRLVRAGLCDVIMDEHTDKRVSRIILNNLIEGKL